MNYVMWMIFAFLSALGSFSLMAVVWLQPKRPFRASSSPVQLIFYLSLCDFFLSLNNGVGYALRIINNGDPLDGFWCSITFFIEHIAVITQILWYSMISFNILLILNGYKDSELRRLQFYQHILIWGYAVCCSIPPMISGNYGPLQATAYCYFPNPKDPRRLLLYIPVTFGVLFALGVFIYSVFFFAIRRGTHKGGYILFRLGFLVVIFTTFWGAATAGRLYDALGNKDQSNFQLIANTLSGFANFVVWTATNRQLITWITDCFTGEESLYTSHDPTYDDTYNSWTQGTHSTNHHHHLMEESAEYPHHASEAELLQSSKRGEDGVGEFRSSSLPKSSHSINHGGSSSYPYVATSKSSHHHHHEISEAGGGGGRRERGGSGGRDDGGMETESGMESESGDSSIATSYRRTSIEDNLLDTSTVLEIPVEEG